MKRWLFVCAMIVGAGALAQDADETPAPAGSETWIPLEDLPVGDQEAALDAAEADASKQAAAPEFSEATDQLVIHAIFTAALTEVGADLLPGTP
jgi:hypothetical protein